MLNRVEIIGNLGKDPEVKTFDSGNRMVSFSMATSEKYKNKEGEQVVDTEWHNVVFWGKIVDVIEKYVTKGDRLFVSGKIKTRSWEADGGTKYITEIIGKDMIMLSTKDAAPGTSRAPDHQPAAATKAQPQTAEQGQAAAAEVDDLPF